MVDAIMSLLGTIIYPLFSIVFLLIDGIQDIFKAFAGTGTVYVSGIDSSATSGTQITGGNTGASNDTGIVYYMFQHKIVKDLLLSIMLLALFLIIIFTAMAFIKNAYSSKPKKWQEIVGNAFIGLANFIFIPVCCLLGVWLGNILLNAIDGATNVSGATSMSRQLFVSSAYNANGFRNEDHDLYELTKDEALAYVKTLVQSNGLENKIEVGTPPQDMDYRVYCADIVDKVYAQSVDIDIGSWGDVMDNYKLMSINYVILAGGGIFLITALVNISFGMVKRLFTLILLFIISPALCAMYPLDDGNAVKQWKGDFVKNTISAYGAVAGMNLFFSIMPLIQQIKLNNILDSIGLTSVLLSIAGLYMVKDFISMISGYVGGKDAYSEGSSLAKSVGSRVKAGAKKVGAFTMGTTKALVKMSGAMSEGGFGAGMRSIGGSALSGLNSGVKSVTGIDFASAGKEYKEAWDAGKKGVIERGAKKEDKELDKETFESAKFKEMQKRFAAGDGAKIPVHEYKKALEAYIDGGGTKEKFDEKLMGKRGSKDWHRDSVVAFREKERKYDKDEQNQSAQKSKFLEGREDDVVKSDPTRVVSKQAQIASDNLVLAQKGLQGFSLDGFKGAGGGGSNWEQLESVIKALQVGGHAREISHDGFSGSKAKGLHEAIDAWNEQVASVKKAQEALDSLPDSIKEAAEKIKTEAASFGASLQRFNESFDAFDPSFIEKAQKAFETGEELGTVLEEITDKVKKAKKKMKDKED